ncbi:MAG: Outer membrane protein SusE [Candidatus Ordinivivax streblomastigis]|uniref:Outer membrane protein SusE n=1 Tax=Candidatus Ordinivivax streblomastigis TaxID=2540710 RepID=A0A5M8NYL8_9BACT|nr:MAG: Outer membrane protein SusE [Candidatus Ordinivivax streblomastigis]
MKKIYILSTLLFGLCLFYACEDDRESNPTLENPDGFVLNIPKYVSGVYDLKNTQSLQFTCSQPNYGFTAAITYSVQIATKENFSEFATLPTTYTTAKIEADASEIAIALVGLLGVNDEPNYPPDPFPVYVRLSAALSANRGETLSNIVELPKVKGYYALEPMTMPQNIYLIGNITENWNWNVCTEMIPVYGTENLFWAIQYLGKTNGVDGDNAEIKFSTQKDGSGNEIGISQVLIDDASIALAGISGDNNIKIGVPGWYLVVVTVEIEGRNYKYQVQFLEPNVYLQGPANGGKWGNDAMLYVFTVPEASAGANAEFVSPAFIGNVETGTTEGVRASIVLPNHDWWQTEFTVIKGNLEYRGKGGDQERVLGNVGQKLYINFTAKTGSIN